MSLYVESAVSIPRTEQWDMRAESSGRTYRIFIAAPAQEPPEEGFPVLYVLDANSVFATLVETLRVQARRPDKTAVVPALIVGIGYPIEEPYSDERHYDFTMPSTGEELPFFQAKGIKPPEQGGAELFMQFIEHELKPVIKCKYDIDQTRQSIVGHSLGGLFVLQMLLTCPSSFNTYVAGSPSIHWNKRYVFDQLAKLPENLVVRSAKIRLLVVVGGDEHSHGMIDNARGLYDYLNNGKFTDIHAQFTILSDEGHVSLLPALMSRAVRFALAPLEGK